MTSQNAQSECRDLWQEAFQSLNPQEKDALPPFTENNIQTDIIEVVTDKLKDAKSKHRVLRLKNGSNVVLQDIFQKVAGWTKKFVEVGDVIAQYDPGHAALPWAGLRFILQASINHFEKERAMTEGVELVSKLLLRSKVQERLFLDTPSSREQELSKAFIQLYCHILKLLAKLCRALRSRRNVGALIVTTFSGADEFDDLFRLIKDDEKLVGKISAQISREEQLHNSKQVRALNHVLRDLERPVERIEKVSNKIADAFESLERDRILDWMSQMPYQKHHLDVKRKTLLGTGLWLFRHSVFRDWKDSSTSQILWLHGVPGSGKSTLLSQFIEAAINNHKAHSSPYPVYFYCSRDVADRGRADPQTILRSLTRQVCSLPGAAALHPDLKARYERKQTEGDVSIDEAANILVQTIEDRQLTFLVIDALDEANADTRYELIRVLHDVLKRARSLVKILVSSRRDDDIVAAMSQHPRLELGAANNGKDIRRYVYYEVDNLIDEKRLLRNVQVSEELRQRIKDELCAGAQGMFKWVELQLQYLCTLALPSLVEKRLRKIPKSLMQIYTDLYDSHVARHEEEENEITHAILCMLLVGQDHLKGNELAALISQAMDLPDSISTDMILRLCFNLVVYEESSEVFRFAHLSVREFLEVARPELLGNLLHRRAASMCIKVILNTDSEHIHRFNYAMRFWPFHASECISEGKTDSIVSSLVESLLLKKPKKFIHWMESLRNNFENMSFWSNISQRIEHILTEPPSQLLVACEWGFGAIAEKLLRRSKDKLILQVENSRGSNALEVTAAQGHCLTAGILLDAGISFQYSLLYAAAQGHINMFRLLCDRGADINIQDNNSYTVLERASSHGHTEMVEYLIFEVGIDPSEVVGHPPIVGAAQNGHLEIVEILLDSDADIHACGPRGETALEYASSLGHRKIVETLIDNGACLNEDKTHLNKALERASYEGYKGIVELLIENHADVNQKVGLLGPPLHAASMAGNIDVVQLLLQSNADINASDGLYGSALTAAAEKAKIKVVKLLIDNNANVNILGGKSLTTLQAASASCKLNIVKLLIAKQADIHVQGGECGSALRAACFWGRKANAAYLLKKGATFGSGNVTVLQRHWKNDLEALMERRGVRVEFELEEGFSDEEENVHSSDEVDEDDSDDDDLYQGHALTNDDDEREEALLQTLARLRQKHP